MEFQISPQGLQLSEASSILSELLMDEEQSKVELSNLTKEYNSIKSINTELKSKFLKLTEDISKHKKEKCNLTIEFNKKNFELTVIKSKNENTNNEIIREKNLTNYCIANLIKDKAKNNSTFN